MGTGLIGDIVEKRCTQCSGTGTISVDNTSTLAALDATVAGAMAGNNHLVVTAPVPVPLVAVKATIKGK